MGTDLLSLENEPVNNIRRQTLNGREYVVADVIMLREGVLPGSKGPLYYPPDEIAANAGMWNGIALTYNHPTLNNTPVSIKSPEIWDKFFLGYIFNDRYDPVTTNRSAEAWYDVEVCNRVDKRIIPAITSGKKVNVSTGLFTQDQKVTDNSSHNGKSYIAIARNYKADHLATLLDDLGACSVKDGCGINVNTSFPEDHMNERKELVSFLTANCDCWKNKEKVLTNEEAFSVDDLKKLKTNVEASTLAINTLKSVGETIKLPTDAKLSDIPGLVKNAMKPDNCDDKKVTMNEEQVNNAVKSFLKGLNEQERIDLIASPTLNNMIKEGKAMVEEKRLEIMKALVANVSNEAEKKAKLLKLKDKSLDQLREYHEFALAANVKKEEKDDTESFLANFFKTTTTTDTATTTNTDTSKKKSSPLIPTFNILEEDTEEAA